VPRSGTLRWSTSQAQECSRKRGCVGGDMRFTLLHHRAPVPMRTLPGSRGCSHSAQALVRESAGWPWDGSKRSRTRTTTRTKREPLKEWVQVAASFRVIRLCKTEDLLGPYGGKRCFRALAHIEPMPQLSAECSDGSYYSTRPFQPKVGNDFDLGMMISDSWERPFVKSLFSKRITHGSRTSQLARYIL
jgi:hypothetical protein